MACALGFAKRAFATLRLTLLMTVPPVCGFALFSISNARTLWENHQPLRFAGNYLGRELERESFSPGRNV